MKARFSLFQSQPQLLFLVWVVTSLATACFHEPWRDEAAAWLIARNAPTLWDLLIRASIEATGPFYYLLLRPAALAFPDLFPGVIFLFSFLGTALFARSFSRAEWVPLSWRWLVLLGFLFGYEYSSIARLYGWGCYFLWEGVCADRKGRRSWAVWFAAAALVQLNFFLAVLGWCAYRGLQRKSWSGAWPLVVGVAVMLTHGTLGASLRNWNWVHWNAFVPFLHGLGSTVATPFVQGPHLAAPGILILLVALWPLSSRARWAMGVAMAAFIFIFVFRYHGNPQARHGGALFVLWIALLAESRPLGRWREKAVQLFLGVNILSGLVMRAQDILYPFSHSNLAAAAIAARVEAEGKPARLYVAKGEDGLTLAALLGSEIWYRGELWGCPFFGATCVPRPSPTQHLQAGMRECARTHLCIFALDGFDTGPQDNRDGKWVPLFRPQQKALRESISVYEFQPND